MHVRNLVTILVLLAAAAFAGPVRPAWEQLYGGEGESELNQAADVYYDTLRGCVYVCGAAELPDDPGSSDMALACYSEDGQLRWIKGLGGNAYSPDDMAHSLVVDSVGNIYIAGVINDSLPAAYDAAWAKYDTAGNEIWQYRTQWPSDDAAYAITIGTGGEVYVCGVDNGNEWLTGYMVARIDPADGDTMWRRSYVLDTLATTRKVGGRDLHPDFFDDYSFWDNCASALTASPDGNVVVTGFGNDADRYLEMWTMKFASDGTRQWAVTYRNPNTVYDDDDVAFDVAVARNNDVYICGFDYFETDAAYQGYNYAVIRYNSSGSRQNWRSINVAAEDGDDYAFSLCLDDSTTQNVYVTGTLCYPVPELEQVATMKLSQALVSRWGSAGATYGVTSGDDRGHNVCYNNGRIYVTGRRSLDLLALGYTAANATPKETLWTYTYVSPESMPGFGAAVHATDSNHVFVAGQCTRPGTPSWTSLYTARLLYGRADMAVRRINTPTGTYNHYDSVIPSAVVTNSGNVITAFTAYMNIGLAYSDTVVTARGINPGDSMALTFKPWLAHPTGRVAVRCSLETEGDTTISNNFRDETVTVRVTDVGVSAILAPADTVDSASVVAPQARVKNFGFATVTFPVWFLIHSAADGTAAPVATARSLSPSPRPARALEHLRNGTLDHSLLQVFTDSVWLTLGQDESTVVTFDEWTTTLPGNYLAEAYTDLYGDNNRANDTARKSVFVGSFVRDAACTAIIAPPDTVDSGDVVNPVAVVANLGTIPGTFTVRFGIGTTYTHDSLVTVSPGMTDTITIAPWTASLLGSHAVRCSTMLTGDANPGNDFRTGQVVVLPMEGIESPENAPGLPLAYSVEEGAPNPFSGHVTVRYALPRPTPASLCIYNPSGVLVRTLTSGNLPAGFHRAAWNGIDDRGRPVQAGTYFCRFQSADFVKVGKIVKTD
jgi:hypothetical protein